MSKIDKSYLDKQDEEIERIFELILSDYILAKELFVKCIDDIRKRFSGLTYNESTLECIEDFIDEKEFIFEETLHNLPEYAGMCY